MYLSRHRALMNVFDKAPILDKEAFVTVILEDDHLFDISSTSVSLARSTDYTISSLDETFEYMISIFFGSLVGCEY
ncbi:hypothetical protein HID58_069251 [Brassica napus]|uniref:Uncharacterized protein n=1 Tax=Brassica napus TaxID=3708 RepID=A0ABQ7XH35_BRANA|nr:hypothetical protein HID58_069251 [Brassica napus]